MAGSERADIAPRRRREAPRTLAAADGARDLPGSMLRLQGLAGNRAVTRLLARSEGSRPPPPRTEGDIVRDLNANGTELNNTRSVAEDALEERGLARPKELDDTMTRLEELAENGDEEAEGLLKQLEPLVERRDGLIEELGRAQAPSGPHVDTGAGEEKFEAPQKGELASEKPPSAGAEPRGAATTAEEASEATASRVEGAAAEAEEALIDRIGAGVGSIVEGLLPTPLDVLAMEAQFAGSYEDAWDAIEERNTRDGIILGITAGIMDLDRAWVAENLGRRIADRDVETEFLGAVGKAERAFNDGLARGHRYGFGHPPALKKKILARAFRALAQRGVQVREEERGSFNTLTLIARLLTPLADDFLAKAAARRKARELKALAQANEERFEATHGRF